MEFSGSHLRVRVEGSGPALLLIHGWALDLDMWQPQFVTLARDHRVIAFDRCGFGLSSGQPDLGRDAQGAVHLLNILDVDEATVVGMSQGARVALLLAQDHPGRVACVVLDGAPLMGSVEHTDAYEEIPMMHYRRLATGHGLDAFRRQWLQHPFTQLRRHDAANTQLLSRMVERYPARDLLTDGRSSPDVRLAEIRMPALVVNGEFDSPARLAAGAMLAQQLPDAQRALVPAAGHLANLDNPAGYNHLLVNFAARHRHATT